MNAVNQTFYQDSDEERLIALQSAEQRCVLLNNHISDIVFVLDEGGMITAINQAVGRYGYQVDELIGQSIRFLIVAEDRDGLTDVLSEAVARRQDRFGRLKFRIIDRTGTVHRLAIDYAVRFNSHGQFLFMQGIGGAIPPTIKGQDIQLSAVSELEEQALIRNAELMLANEELHREVIERREAENALKEREAALELEKANLQETNTALRVLLKRREMDKHEFEDHVMYNVKELILPFMDRLKAVTSDERQLAYLRILESNLNDITTAFLRRLSLEFYGLTPSERKVATFIRQGKRTREIASLLGLSMRTIDAVRMSIRRKLRIQNKRINLRTFLMSIN
jgi:PAS domain S-box-containing protein